MPEAPNTTEPTLADKIKDMEPLVPALNALADKLNAMWGKSPDADLIRRGAKAIGTITEAASSEEAPAVDQSKAKKGTKNA